MKYLTYLFVFFGYWQSLFAATPYDYHITTTNLDSQIKQVIQRHSGVDPDSKLGKILEGHEKGTIDVKDYLDFVSISSNQASEVKQKLEAFENGKITREDLTERAGEEGRRQLLGYYLLHTNDFSAKAKYAVGRTYLVYGRYTEATKITLDYVNVYSNDIGGWRVLGWCYLGLGASNEVIQAYSTLVKLGDDTSYEPLAGYALIYNRLDIIQKMLPQLMAMKESPVTPRLNRANLISILLGYSILEIRKDIFIKTLEGTDMRDILADENVKSNIAQGCKMFEGKDIDTIRQTLEAFESTEQGKKPSRN